MDDSILTRKAIDEIMRATDENKNIRYGPQERKKNPLGRPNKRFLNNTLNSVLSHNKRHMRRTVANCQRKLEELDANPGNQRQFCPRQSIDTINCASSSSNSPIVFYDTNSEIATYTKTRKRKKKRRDSNNSSADDNRKSSRKKKRREERIVGSDVDKRRKSNESKKRRKEKVIHDDKRDIENFENNLVNAAYEESFSCPENIAFALAMVALMSSTEPPSAKTVQNNNEFNETNETKKNRRNDRKKKHKLGKSRRKRVKSKDLEEDSDKEIPTIDLSSNEESDLDSDNEAATIDLTED